MSVYKGTCTFYQAYLGITMQDHMELFVGLSKSLIMVVQVSVYVVLRHYKSRLYS